MRDDELTRLERQVTDFYAGDEREASQAIDAATERALNVVNQLPIDLAADAKPVPMTVFYDALKADLRRLVQPH